MVAPRTKGLQFRSFLRALKEVRGDAAVEGTLNALRPELGEALRLGTIVTGGWYPLQWYKELHHAAQRATGEGMALSRAVSKAGIQADFRGVYRLITLALAPESIFKWAPKVVGLYYDTGRCVIEAAEESVARGRFEGFLGFDEALWEDMLGGITGVMELAGAKHIATRMLEGGGDGEDARVEVRWRR